MWTKASIAAFAGLLASSASSPVDPTSSCPDDVLTLSVDDVQSLLKDWNLDQALATEFSAQSVDGFMLAHISAETVDRSAYPSAQPFHWTALFTRLELCKIGQETRTQMKKQAKMAVGAANADDRADRRALGARKLASAHSGIHIVSETSTIALGPDADVMLYRSDENVLSMDNHVSFSDGNGLLFSNEEGDDISINSDDQGNLYIGGNIHFTGNVTFSGLDLDNYIAKQYDILTAQAGPACSDGNCTSCAAILDADPTAIDGVYLVDGDGPGGYDPQYAYCDMSDGGWTMLMRYSESGYEAEFNYGEAQVPTSSGGSPPPTDRIWAPMPAGFDDGHLNLLAFDITGGRHLKAGCTRSGTYYEYDTTLVEDWTAGVFGEDQEDGNALNEVGWVILSGNDIGLEGRSHHYICGANDYSGARGIGFCSGGGGSGNWAPHLASLSFWPTSQAVGCAGGDGSTFELWVR